MLPSGPARVLRLQVINTHHCRENANPEKNTKGAVKSTTKDSTCQHDMTRSHIMVMTTTKHAGPVMYHVCPLSVPATAVTVCTTGRLLLVVVRANFNVRRGSATRNLALPLWASLWASLGDVPGPLVLPGSGLGRSRTTTT
jgi:hypothetical protein